MFSKQLKLCQGFRWMSSRADAGLDLHAPISTMTAGVGRRDAALKEVALPWCHLREILYCSTLPLNSVARFVRGAGRTTGGKCHLRRQVPIWVATGCMRHVLPTSTRHAVADVAYRPAGACWAIGSLGRCCCRGGVKQHSGATSSGCTKAKSGQNVVLLVSAAWGPLGQPQLRFVPLDAVCRALSVGENTSTLDVAPVPRRLEH